MKLLIIADLHLDEVADADTRRSIGEAIRIVGREADALIIAGDLCEAAMTRWPQAIRWLGTVYPTEKTIIFPGNHDYYGDNLCSLDQRLAALCAELGCRFGQCQCLTFGDTRVLMTTLWTDLRLFSAEGEAAVAYSIEQATMMPDYGYGAITVGDLNLELQPQDTVRVHDKQKLWLVAELNRPWPGKTVVITHHAPSAAVAGRMTPLSPCFASDLDILIDHHQPAAWIFGHTHRAAELIMLGGTLLRNVSVGYVEEWHAGQIEDRIRRGLIDLRAI